MRFFRPTQGDHMTKCVASLETAVLAHAQYAHTELQSLDALPPLPAVEVWLVGPRSLVRVPRVRAVWDFLEAQLAVLGAGRVPAP